MLYLLHAQFSYPSIPHRSELISVNKDAIYSFTYLTVHYLYRFDVRISFYYAISTSFHRYVPLIAGLVCSARLPRASVMSGRAHRPRPHLY